MTRTLVAASLAAGIAALAWACSTSPSTVTGLALDGPTTAAVGEMSQFTATTIGGNGSRQDVTAVAVWTAAPADVIRSASRGSFLLLAPGVATVTAQQSGFTKSVQLQVVNPTLYRLSGTVRDSGGQPIRGAFVTLFTANHSTMKTVPTDSFGGYALTIAAGSYSLQAEFAGVNTPSQQVALTEDRTIDITITVPAGTVSIAGAWTATFSAPSNCVSQLPPEAAQRTYDTAITQYAPTLVALRFTSALPQPAGGVASTGLGQVAGEDVIWSMLFDAYYGAVDGGIVERLAPTRWLNIVGTVGGTRSGNTISATLTGEFDIYDTPTPVSTVVATLVPSITCKGTSLITLQQTNGVAAIRRR